MSVDTNIIDSLNLFEDLSHAEMEEIASLMRRIRVTEGEAITRRNAPAHTIFILLSGNFMVFFKDGRSYTLHNKGDVIGLSTVVLPFYYTGTAVALSDGVVLSMPGQELLRLIESNPVLSNKIMKKINQIVSARLPFVTGRC
ncbi:MAG: Crp/Fnr family transcriptional regulator [Desulfobacterales bacterium]|jgi:CRP-like cAMP-binding protein|nr:Crp/Fnr family transcriptional regulator [Desulfobacterales bacterium]